jgi:hypothetical protein
MNMLHRILFILFDYLGQQYKLLTETYNLMKLDNYRFPPLKESEAMFENNDIAPEWRDDKECFRCRQTFTTFIRKVSHGHSNIYTHIHVNASFHVFLSSITVEPVVTYFVINVSYQLLNIERC